ncbi:PREDICTED: uncharacterized protein LOC107340496 [Acropora digitifera]|uniref:uncharacterized protein LOC107340496 n=1 Tax=Acropora digitifera TaxID=70779 RepID=UPI00077A3B6D|nr:PREDICTED: uncharacterized protein LOC107340496 [Acropora digitifera]
MLQFLIIAGLFQSSYSCTKIDNCSCKKSNGHIMNLRPIDGGKSGPKFTGEETSGDINYKFSWNPCTPFSSADGCKNVLLCQANGKLQYPAGENVELFAETKGTDSITITYSPMKKEGDKSSRQGVITLKCDPSIFPGKFITQFTEDKMGSNIEYRATFASKCVCDNGCPAPTPAGNHGRKELSTGSILLIVFIPLVFIYCITGALYNKYNKGIGSFPEMIPNHSFWIGLPSLIKEGCAFTFHSLASCCSSLLMRLKGESYAEI